MKQSVWLVLDTDRNVLDVCVSEETALTLAEKQDGFAEKWPVSTSPRERAWARGLGSVKGHRGIVQSSRPTSDERYAGDTL